MINTPGNWRTSPWGMPRLWPPTMAAIPLRATLGEKNPKVDICLSSNLRYNFFCGSATIGKGTLNFAANSADSDGVPIPTRTTWAPAFSMLFLLRRNCATCSRQNGQPKCRKKTSTSVWLCQRSRRRFSEPSANLTSASGALDLLFFIVISPCLAIIPTRTSRN